ncbi:MAG: hypothetical protein GX896_07620 [Clostridiales bacterium]|nr:hypothetical protein [Clostridiales bacterium]
MSTKEKVISGIIAVGVYMLASFGQKNGFWEFWFKPLSLIGFIAIVPAVFWIFKKGLNFVNSGLYFTGLGFVMYINLFTGLCFRFIILCILLVLTSIVLPITMRLFGDGN